MKHLLSFLLLPFSLPAQTLSPVLLAPAGGMTAISVEGSLSWSVGEVAIAHERAGSALLTQGFQQIEADTTLAPLPSDPKRLQILLPNLITPNGDGRNDVFDPVDVLEGYRYYVPRDKTELVIVNRWGEVVFRKGPYERWDGGSMPQAAYYFRLRRTDTGRVITEGPIHLLR
ncbi:MAG TPA: gliding motility-associated C-terminal domain-containing protein [Saprospiraceae bacterium]|nr:gliding motility-associated C-terminal domain-containing protein [Saprospiraceae bacterium]HND87550.1 gliding motility-associated C-terminal domain-containing protein [Saprospiraceae bacterium]HNG88917.1 gliding motility-associated C-terminal domain-containing protein [Saprospiraceae bacterium]